ncbi:MAG: T9SS type A sorting domain-containing protein [Bacteroidota bacterium]
MKRLRILSFLAIFGSTVLNAQCYEDRHNGNWFDSWISCETSPNPNSSRGNGHWIFYDLHHTYSLGTSTIWNLNNPENLDLGMNEIVLDYSLDGTNWEEWGEFTVAQAPGISTYEGIQGPNLSGVQAKYLLITVLSNHGGEDCVGMSEIRINVEDVVISDIPEIEENTCLSLNVYPNPHSSDFTSKITTICPELISWMLFDVQGKKVRDGALSQVAEENFLEISSNKLPKGLYHLVVIQGDNRVRKPVLKVD